MQLPLTDPDTLFEELLQDLPPTTMQMARDFKAFVRTKKVKAPEQLLRLIRDMIDARPRRPRRPSEMVIAREPGSA